MDFKPGSKIAIEITKEPTLERDIDTVVRLMRMETSIQRALARNAEDRKRTTPTSMRAGRVWTIRPKVGKLCQPHIGQKWTLDYRPQIAPDLKRVEKFLKIKSA
jgi:hypothetical protein